MNDLALYSNILGIQSPWKVTEARPKLTEGSITIRVEIPASQKLVCPECGRWCVILSASCMVPTLPSSCSLRN